MPENLAQYYHQFESEKAERERIAEERRQAEAATEALKTKELSQNYLNWLKKHIPEDAKESWRWKNGRLTYHMTKYDREAQGVAVRRVKDKKLDWWHNYIIHDEVMWNEFVDWAKDHGLAATVEEECHSEYNRDEGYSVHDYYYVALRPLLVETTKD